MQTKRHKHISNQQNKDNTESISIHHHGLLPAVFSILLGIATLITSYQIASILIFSDPNHEFAPFIVVISIGFFHLLASIISSILWLRHIKWSRYTMMILAIISTIILLFYTFSSFYFLLVFISAILDVYLFYTLFLKKGTRIVA